eukprot:scaffold3474_cov111-Isochrysis_galbana.AAC.4
MRHGRTALERAWLAQGWVSGAGRGGGLRPTPSEEAPRSLRKEGGEGCSHVEPQVLPLPILDQEGVVRAEARPLAWEEQPCQRQHHARLQVVKQWPHPDLVQDEAVVIHGVWPLNGLPARLVSLALGEQLGAECGLQHLKRKHPAGHLLREDRAQCGLGPVSQGRC